MNQGQRGAVKRWSGKAWVYIYCPSGRFNDPRAWMLETDEQNGMPPDMPRLFGRRSVFRPSAKNFIRVRVTITPITRKVKVKGVERGKK